MEGRRQDGVRGGKEDMNDVRHKGVEQRVQPNEQEEREERACDWDQDCDECEGMLVLGRGGQR